MIDNEPSWKKIMEELLPPCNECPCPDCTDDCPQAGCDRTYREEGCDIPGVDCTHTQRKQDDSGSFSVEAEVHCQVYGNKIHIQIRGHQVNLTAAVAVILMDIATESAKETGKTPHEMLHQIIKEATGIAERYINAQ